MMSAWRTALRMARREARRAKGRSALVVAMIVLPVAALAFLAVNYDMFTPTSDEKADQSMGAAQAVVSWPSADPVRQLPDVLRSFPAGAASAQRQDPPGPVEHTDQQVLSLLPQGSRVLREQTGNLELRTASGVGNLQARKLDYTDPLARGLFRQLSGRAPSNPDEVALTPSAVDRLGAGVGGTARLADGTRTFSIVGIVENPANLRATTVLMHPGGTPLSDDPASVDWLVGAAAPITWTQVKELNTHGMVALSRHVMVNPPAESERYQLGVRFNDDGPPAGVLVLIGGLAMLEIVLLAGPAFAVSARRRQRELALVAASGATPSQVRRIVLADGVVLGAVAAVVGAGLGIATAVVLRPVIEEYLTQRAIEFRIWPLAQLVLVGLAVLTGVLAALVPAWSSSRQDIVMGLAGRRGITRSRRRWLAIGVVLGALGATAVILGALNDTLELTLAGLVGFELGIVLCTPALVGLVARIGRWLPVAPRIALRDTSRNRSAAAPAISAVMAVVVGSLAIAVIINAESRKSEQEFSGRPGEVAVYSIGTFGPGGRDTSGPPAELETMLRANLPIDQVALVSDVSCDRTDCFVQPRLPAELDCPFKPINNEGRPPTAEEQRAARADPRCAGISDQHSFFAGTFGSPFGISVVIDADSAGAVANLTPEDAAAAAAALRAGKVVVSDSRYLVDGKVSLALFKVGREPEDHALSAPGFAVAHPPKAPFLLMTKDIATSLGLGSHPVLTFATTTRMPTTAEEDRLRAALGNDYAVQVARGLEATDQQLMILAIVAGIIALGAAAMATGLAAAEGRADLGTLAAVGASPRLRRALTLSQSGVIAGLGSILGCVAGLGASTAVLFALNRQYVDVWPERVLYPITVPWLNLLVALLVVPGIAMLGAGLLTRSRLPIERRL